MGSYRTVSALLTTLLGDLELLASPSLVRGGSIPSIGDRDPVWWSDLLVMRYADVQHPALRYEMEALIDSCGGDWLVLLLDSARCAAEDPEAALSLGRFPLVAFAEQGAPIRCLDGVDVADSHLHSGGSMPIGVLVSGLATRPAALPVPRTRTNASLEGNSPPPRGSDGDVLRMLGTDGCSWNSLVLLAAVRWALRLFWYVERGGDLSDQATLESRGLKQEIVLKVTEGWFWEEVKRWAQEADPATVPLEGLNCAFPPDGICPDLSRLVKRWRIQQPLGVQESEAFLLSTIRAVAAIASMAMSKPGEGLSTFSSRFRRMGEIQRIAIGRPKDSPLASWSKRLVAMTIKEVAPDSQVVAAEFRKTFKGTDSAKLRSAIRRELAIHHLAFAEFTQNEHPMSLTMPVAFDREPAASLNPAESAPQELEHALAMCHALETLALETSEAEALREAIWSIDVVGPELGSSNWPFVFAAHRLHDAGMSLVFTIHAGESFVSELNGIRRVGELLMGPVKPKRIGHALSLSPRASAAVTARGQLPVIRAEAIMDLAWLCVETGSIAAHDVLRDLVRRVGANEEIQADSWIEGFKMLYEPREVERLLRDDGVRLSKESPQTWFEAAEAGAPAERAFAALAWAAPPEIAGCNVKDVLCGQELSAYVEVSTRESSAARELVLAKIKAEEVTIECCPTSNIVLAGMPDYRAHPFWEWSGVSLTVSSDDPLQFGSNVLGELRALLATGLDPEAVAKAAAKGATDCSGGKSKRLKGWVGYNDIVGLVDDELVRPLPV